MVRLTLRKIKMSQVWREGKVLSVTHLGFVGKGVGVGVGVGDLKAGDRVKITGTSKGRGFAGVVKRHGFAGGPKTHGQSDRWRAPGSVGGTTTPGRIYKGKKMAGRFGGDRVSYRTRVAEVLTDKRQLVVIGPVPGAVRSLVRLEKV